MVRRGTTNPRAEIEPAGGNRAVDQQRTFSSCCLNRRRQSILEKCAKGTQRVFLQRHAGGHGMAAAFKQNPFLNGAPYSTAKIDTGDGTPGTRPRATGLQCDRKGRTAIALLQTRCHQPDHAGVPALPGRDDYGTNAAT